MNIYGHLFIFISINYFSVVTAQTPSEAKEAFNSSNYKIAQKLYSKLLIAEPGNKDYQYKLAVSLLKTRSELSKSLDYFIELKKENYNSEVIYHCAVNFHLLNKFDEAIADYLTYKEKLSERQKTYINRQIEMCRNGKEIIQFPLDITFENLGKNVNTEFSEMIPLIPSNEDFVLFTTKRKGTIGNTVDKNGEPTSDIYISEVKKGEWAKAKSIGPPLNTSFNESASGLSPDGKTLFIFVDNTETSGVGDIYISSAKGKVFQRPEMLGENVNSAKYEEVSATTSVDGNKLFFSSEKEGGKGGRDIYMAYKLPTGDWGISTNLGEKINSPYNEDYPFLSADGKTLYFSSQGHNSIGGYDIFKSSWNEENSEWQEPKNIGYPLNTADDNFNFVISSTNRDAYVSAIRPEGFGDYDIYKVTFNQIDPKYTVFKGFIQSTDSVNLKTDAAITIISKRTKNIFGSYTIPASKQGKYLFYLPPGKYEMEIEADGFKTLNKDVIVQDKTAFKDEIYSNHILNRIGEEKSHKASSLKKPQTPTKK